MPRSNRILVYLLLLITGFCIGVLLAWVNPSLLAKTKLVLKEYLLHKSIEKKLWNQGFELVEIESSIDSKKQKAYYYPSKSTRPMPLIVSLHTWGGDYREYDSLALLGMSRDINYIHPDFRGPNVTPDACCSSLAIGDIDDAIDYAINNANVDRNKIYVVGKSGGGYAAISLFMKSKHDINTFSAWVPITDLTKWYTEGQIRKNGFTADILKCTSSDKEGLDLGKAKERSPIFWPTPIKAKKNTKLNIYAGVYDGIVGSVPISHSIDFYNKVIADFGATDTLDFVSEQEKLSLMAKRNPLGDFGSISNRKIFIKKKFQNVELILFDGGHEMLPVYAFKNLFNEY